MPVPIAVLLAAQCSDDRLSPQTRASSVAGLKALKTEFIVTLGLYADLTTETAVFLRSLDESWHDPSKTQREVRSFCDRRGFGHCFFFQNCFTGQMQCWRIAETQSIFWASRMRLLFLGGQVLDGQVLDGEGTMTHTVVREAMQCGPIFYQARLFLFRFSDGMMLHSGRTRCTTCGTLAPPGKTTRKPCRELPRWWASCWRDWKQNPGFYCLRWFFIFPAIVYFGFYFFPGVLSKIQGILVSKPGVMLRDLWCQPWKGGQSQRPADPKPTEEDPEGGAPCSRCWHPVGMPGVHLFLAPAFVNQRELWRQQGSLVPGEKHWQRRTALERPHRLFRFPRGFHGKCREKPWHGQTDAWGTRRPFGRSGDHLLRLAHAEARWPQVVVGVGRDNPWVPASNDCHVPWIPARVEEETWGPLPSLCQESRTTEAQSRQSNTKQATWSFGPAGKEAGDTIVWWHNPALFVQGCCSEAFAARPHGQQGLQEVPHEDGAHQAEEHGGHQEAPPGPQLRRFWRPGAESWARLRQGAAGFRATGRAAAGRGALGGGGRVRWGRPGAGGPRLWRAGAQAGWRGRQLPGLRHLRPLGGPGFPRGAGHRPRRWVAWASAWSCVCWSFGGGWVRLCFVPVGNGLGFVFGCLGGAVSGGVCEGISAFWTRRSNPLRSCWTRERASGPCRPVTRRRHARRPRQKSVPEDGQRRPSMRGWSPKMATSEAFCGTFFRRSEAWIVMGKLGWGTRHWASGWKCEKRSAVCSGIVTSKSRAANVDRLVREEAFPKKRSAS